MSQNASSVDGDGVGEIRAGGAHDTWQCSRRAPAAHHCGSRLSPGGRWVASICGCSLMQIALYYRSNPHIFTVVSMDKALTAVVVTLLAIGSAQAQRRTCPHSHHIDLFAASLDGGTYPPGGMANGTRGSGLAERSFAPKAPITAVSRKPNHIDLFAVGPDGGSYSTWWDNGLHDWFPME